MISLSNFLIGCRMSLVSFFGQIFLKNLSDPSKNEQSKGQGQDVSTAFIATNQTNHRNWLVIRLKDTVLELVLLYGSPIHYNLCQYDTFDYWPKPLLDQRRSYALLMEHAYPSMSCLSLGERKKNSSIYDRNIT